MIVDTSAIIAVLKEERTRLAYALAKSMREPLLFKGDDFSHTDVAIA